MTEKELEIELLSSHWIKFEDDDEDLCSHGQVRVRIGQEIIVDEGEKENFWTTSAMAVHLLRTLKDNHNSENPVGEHLIPCCGHHIDHLEGEENVHIQGCMTGHNFWVEHNNDKVILKTENGTKVQLPFEDYKKEVLRFVDKVEDLYRTSKTKKLPKDDYDRVGYEMMREEWKKRRNEIK